MSETLIKVERVSKKFCRSLKKSLWYGLQDLGNELMVRRHGGDGTLRQDEFWAVKDIDFKLNRGECLGLIGRNGAGKTTLLRMLNGLIRPDNGRIEMRGSVGAMIAIGAGMKGVLTGRENAYSMAALRGMTRREAAKKIDEIIEFAEIDDAIDAPMQSYSTGMRVRLNFAVASTLNPDVLLLDEVLAVGDTSFRNKCYHRIAELRRQAAVIFVSHNMEQVARISTNALVLQRGELVYSGSIDEGIQRYERLNQDSDEQQICSDSFLSIHPPFMDFTATLSTQKIKTGGSLDVELNFSSEASMTDFALKILFYNSNGAFAADGCIKLQQDQISINPGRNTINLHVESIPLKNGVYAVAFNLMDRSGDVVIWSYKQQTIHVEGAYVGAIADCQLQLQARSGHE